MPNKADKLKKLLNKRFFQEFRVKTKDLNSTKDIEKIKNNLEEKRIEAIDFLVKNPNIKYDTKEWNKLTKIVPFPLFKLDYEEILQESNEREIELLTAKDLLEMEITETDWIIENFIPSNSIGILAAPRSSYKTWMALWFAVHISKGKDLFDEYRVKKKNVLYIDEENGINNLVKRTKMMLKEKIENLYFLTLQNINFHKKEDYEKLEEIIKEKDIDLVIVDTFNKVFSIHHENKAEEYVEIFRNIVKPLRTKYNLTWLYLHHPRKGLQGNNGISDYMDEVRGSSEFVNTADFVLNIRRIKQSDLINFRISKMRCGGEILPIKLKMYIDDDLNEMDILYEGEVEESQSAVEEAVVEILSWVSDNHMVEFRTSEVKSALKNKINSVTIQRALKRLVDTGQLRKEKRGFYNIPYDQNDQNDQRTLDHKKHYRGNNQNDQENIGFNNDHSFETNDQCDHIYSMIRTLIIRKKQLIFANSERGLTYDEMLEEEGYSEEDCKNALKYLLKNGICYQNPKNKRYYPVEK